MSKNFEDGKDGRHRGTLKQIGTDRFEKFSLFLVTLLRHIETFIDTVAFLKAVMLSLRLAKENKNYFNALSLIPYGAVIVSLECKHDGQGPLRSILFLCRGKDDVTVTSRVMIGSTLGLSPSRDRERQGTRLRMFRTWFVIVGMKQLFTAGSPFLFYY